MSDRPALPLASLQIEALQRELGLTAVAARLLQRRGMGEVAAARRFLRPRLQDLHDPFLMEGMEDAVSRLERALRDREKILVYGDYDVDGCTAVALVYGFLRRYASGVDYYVPDRYDEGYGVTEQGVDWAAENGFSLVIVLDCGIKAVREIASAKERGIDFIVCDHHVPDDVLPPAAAILNPKLSSSSYPCRELCGCGVGLKFMQALAQREGLSQESVTPFLDLCAVATAADLVPLTGENRVLLALGLRQLSSRPSIGMQALMEVCGATGEVRMSDIIYKIGPRINAAGRMTSGNDAVALLTATEYQSALCQARELDLLNERRKDLDRQMTEEACALVEQQRRSDLLLSVQALLNRPAAQEASGSSSPTSGHARVSLQAADSATIPAAGTSSALTAEKSHACRDTRACPDGCEDGENKRASASPSAGCSVICHREWNKGVIGIVASRLVEIYHRPAVVITVSDGLATGSARSTAGFDILAAVESCRDLLTTFGGHTYAAGLSLKEENVPLFTRRIRAWVDSHWGLTSDRGEGTLTTAVDAVLSFADITPRLLSDLRRMRPFGPGNETPRFLSRRVWDYGTSRVVGRGQEHIRLELVDDSSAKVMNGIAFGQSAQARYIKSKHAFDIVYTLEDNIRRPGETQLQIEDIRPSVRPGDREP